MVPLLFKEKYLSLAFKTILILKAVHAGLEIIGGIFVNFITQDFTARIVYLITQEELAEDPHDKIANYIVTSVHHFSITSQHFAALYLLSHGIIKMILVIALLKKKLWAYPVSIVVFSLFIIYQLYRFTFTHSLWLIFFTILDVIITMLTIHEYRYMKEGLLKRL